MHAITDEDLNQAASQTEGLSGAEIENIVNLAALQSVRKAQSMKLDSVELQSPDFLLFVEGFMQDKKNSQSIGMRNNPNPHHYYR